MHYCKCCALRGSLNLMAPNFKMCSLSLPQFYRKSHDAWFYCLTYNVFRKILLISEWHLHICFYFEPHETNRTKILRKLWCAMLQIGVEGVKGEEGTLTYPPAFFRREVFENSSQSFIEWRQKGGDLTQSYDKSPYTNRNVKRAKRQHKQRHKNVRLNSSCGPT